MSIEGKFFIRIKYSSGMWANITEMLNSRRIKAQRINTLDLLKKMPENHINLCLLPRDVKLNWSVFCVHCLRHMMKRICDL